ncbi:ArsR/SmtB family transcription factor [Corynebacterium guangdongense]|uniref:DNA-binding transcriptional ArsR family regulator n=1 Tax=Corynebacterium guangdongense TaxID=1783348 RepID=A0ABU1ZYY4_9CORY|nr:metalloregulator ArsR/SmtB family transcription factor [Corynebacterium guangdongense]MDR7330152.1 DNA-binding transcriptional ArsR family regulator [Corynebacterium guangdongense]WJZ18710.1 HTH-type transcriptional regulator KmtR [Corynebacterium guangdongense]
MHDALKYPVPDADHARIAADTFRLLADPTRVRILWALFQDESSVNALAELVEATPSTVSQHLAKLRLAGLVSGRREGTFVHYRATESHVRRLLAEALSHAEHLSGAVADASGHGYRVE